MKRDQSTGGTFAEPALKSFRSPFSSEWLQVSRLFAGIVVIALLQNLPIAAGQKTDAPVVVRLEEWLKSHELNDAALTELKTEPWASSAISNEDSERASELLWSARREFLRKERASEMEAREIVLGKLRMPFWFRTFGDAPADGRSLFISMHGGGGAPKAVNDQQYENQKRLYQPKEGVYLVPRAPTNTWNLWHEGHIDLFFDQLITNMIVFENVNPDRVYLMGYSAGGDGVYQLAPRMADRLAAAAMMAGHPNESRPEGLRNIAFTIHMGANDSAYNRNRIAAEWGQKLDALQASDPDGYIHETTIHADRGHWMNLQDAVAVPWMAKFKRNAWPDKVNWIQDDIVHSRFYWLQTDPTSAKAGDEVIASVSEQQIRIEKTSVATLTILLNDRLMNLDMPVTVALPDGSTSEHRVNRSVSSLATSLQQRHDPAGLTSASISLTIPAGPANR